MQSRQNKLSVHFLVKTPGYLSTFASLGFIFILMLALNHFTPLWGDDWWRAVESNNIPHIFKRIGEEYMNWTGRASVLFLTFLFLLKYPGSVWLFNIVNSLVFCTLLIAIFRAATGRLPGKRQQDFIVVLLIFCCLWFFTQSFGEAVFWKTGAIAYLWVVTAAIFLLTPFVNLLANQQVLRNSPSKLWLYPLFALFWGMGLENVAISCSVFMFYSLLAARLKGIKTPRWYWQVLLGQVLGTCALIIAPGNYVRVAMQDDGQPLWLRLAKLSEVIWNHGTSITHIFIAMAALLVIMGLMRQRFALQRFYLWFVIGLLFAFTMVGSTGVNFANRTAFVAEVCFIVAVANLIYLCIDKLQPLYVLPLPVLVLILSIWGADGIKTYEQYLATWQQTQRRAELMASYKENGVTKILLPSMSIPYQSGLKDNIVDQRYFLRDIHPDIPSNGWRNSSYANYHNFTFSNRLIKPHLIYEPELAMPARFKLLNKTADISLYYRKEKHGFKNSSAIYLVGNKKTCSANKMMQVHPKNIEQFKARNKQAKFHQTKGEKNIAWVTLNGLENRNHCVLRFPLPQWPIETILLAGQTIAWEEIEN